MVYKCLDTQTNTIVAVKEMDIVDKEDMEVYEAEVSVHRTIVHPNIVRFIDNFQDNYKHYIVLEYCPHGDLENFIKMRKRAGKPLNEEELTKLYTQLADSLTYLH